MKKYLFYFLSLSICFATCSDDDDGSVDFINNLNSPQNVNAVFEITQDNSGLVTITPFAEGANSFEIDLGDGSGTVTVLPGRNTQHTYTEGVFNLTITATNLAGKETSLQKELTVSFKAPENLEVTVEPVPNDNFSIRVSATADFETFFQVFFGDTENETPTAFNQGDVITHTYPAVGEYELRVIALSGGEATSEFTQIVSITNPLLLPVDFESETLDFSFINFEGATTTVIDNPDASSFNNSGKVAQFVKGDGAQFFAGSILELDENIDFSSLRKIKMKVWSPKSNIIVKLKLENATDPNISAEVDVRNKLANQWEELIFDFTGLSDGKDLSKLIFFFDFENGGDGATYFFDDIEQTNDSVVPLALPLDFEDANQTFTTFNGASFSFAADPENSNNQVGQVVNSGNQFEGMTLQLDEAVDFSTEKIITLRFFTSNPNNAILLKFENGTADPVEVIETVTQSGWNTVSFDFSQAQLSFPLSGPIDATGAYNNITIFVDGPDFKPGTYFFDDIIQGTPSGPSTPINLPLDFENTQTNFVWSGFGAADFGPIPASVINNPDASGINTSSRVVEIIKTAGAQIWAGASLNLDGIVSFANGTTAVVKVWSPRAGTPILFKMEDSSSPPDGNGNPSVFVEVQASTSVANAWEELSFDLTSFNGFSTSISYDRVILFPDFGNNGNGESFFFDDIRISAGNSNNGGGGGTGGTNTPPNNPINFEAGGFGANWTWTVFENATNPPVEIVANPDASGINTSSTVLKVTALQAGNPWAGFESQHGSDIGSFTFDQTNKIVRIMVWKSVISDIGLKFAENNGEAQPEIKIPNTKINEWEEITFDMSSLIGKGITGIIDQIIIFPDFDLSGRTSDNVVYIDNIRFSSQ